MGKSRHAQKNGIIEAGIHNGISGDTPAMLSNLNPDKSTVLVVDDEIGALTLMGIIFERGGFNVFKARSSVEAFTLLDQHTVDLITSDVMRPGMSGIEFCRVLRSREDTRSTPIIIISARGDTQSIRQGIEAGANEYLVKPLLHYNLPEIARRLIAEVNRHRSSGTGSRGHR